jgi:hypothetical protein
MACAPSPANHVAQQPFVVSPEKARDLRLDQYLSINTSEDNISFEHIMEETQKKERTKLHQAWLYKQQALTHTVRCRLGEKRIGLVPHDPSEQNERLLCTTRAVEWRRYTTCPFHPSKYKLQRTIQIRRNSGPIPLKML